MLLAGHKPCLQGSVAHDFCKPPFLNLLAWNTHVLIMLFSQLRPDRLPLPRLLTSLDDRIYTVADALNQLRINILFHERRTKLCLFIKQLLQFIGDAIMICSLDAIGIHISAEGEYTANPGRNGEIVGAGKCLDQRPLWLR